MAPDALARLTRRRMLARLGAALCLPGAARPSSGKPLRGIFVIMATPYNAAREVDFDDLAGEVAFLEECGVHGIVWPQLASEYARLSKEERFGGMEVLAKAHQGMRSALVLGVQGPGVTQALEYVERAESLQPDALIAIPPTEAKTIGDFEDYYRAIARATKRPVFIQTTGGAKELVPEVEALVRLAREFPNLGHIKEEYEPVVPRMIELARRRPDVKAVFSGGGGRGMIYEMRLGIDGTMPGAPYADLYVRVWDAWRGGNHEQAREIFSKLLLMLNCEQQVPGTRLHIMRKRGVFKTRISRQRDFVFTPEAEAEIDFHWAAVKPYLARS
ncbi:MAG: dihydrodipicolinate synthase family protein [Bryobacteraceae bacterium]|nr:dihydrodipicolinate synthase family protein [Bryobacteraceae bacterium]